MKCVQVYQINQREVIKQAHLEFSNLRDGKVNDGLLKGHAWVRMPNQTQWSRVYVRVEAGCISICRDIATNDFTYLYVLYNCEIDMMQLRIKERTTV